MSGESPDARIENAVKQLVFYTEDPGQPVAAYEEVMAVPIPDRGDIVQIARGEGYVPVGEDDLEFNTESLGRYLVKDIEYSYQNLTYPEEDETEVRRLYCSVYIEMEPA